ncbi:hypothetical protein J22TS3_49240 [Paenibacillus sp. J22TS3]|nr:hypothetical protein J22TS3_49240 [Paenibacillus sp. J22TS3]
MLGTNRAEYLSKEQLKRYTEVGEEYVGMSSRAFQDELRSVIKEMAREHLSKD